MRRTDRLFDLIQILRDGKLHRASDMAAALEVSTRTIWRDMATLIASGLPVEGERGVGYILSAPITLPPVALTRDEMEALRLGVQLVASAADPSLAGQKSRRSHRTPPVIRAAIPLSLPVPRPPAPPRACPTSAAQSASMNGCGCAIRPCPAKARTVWCGPCSWNSGAGPGP